MQAILRVQPYLRVALTLDSPDGHVICTGVEQVEVQSCRVYTVESRDPYTAENVHLL